METGIISLKSGSRPEGMADVPGVCDLSLTRAVVQYRESDGSVSGAGSLDDIGLAVVVDGGFAGAAEALDLGSGNLKILDLSSELIVLGWVHQPTLDYINNLIETQQEELASYSFQLAIKLLSRIGFGPLTRSTLLRIGFRDICQDLDLHEDTSVRIVLNPDHDVMRVNLDYRGGSLIFTVPEDDRCRIKEEALVEAFPENQIIYVGQQYLDGPARYEVLFAVASSLTGVRLECSVIRKGLIHLLEMFEPKRHEVIGQHLAIFGHRDTLSQIPLGEYSSQVIVVSDEPSGRDAAATDTVH